MSIAYVDNHVERVLTALVPPLWGLPNIAALLESWALEVQAVEDALRDVLLHRLVDSAEGVHLDKIGALVGLGRGGWSDDDYRLLLKAQIAANDSDGTQADLIGVIQYVTAAGITIQDGSNASMTIALGATVALLEPLATILEGARAAGVGLIVGAPLAGNAMFRQDVNDPQGLPGRGNVNIPGAGGHRLHGLAA